MLIVLQTQLNTALTIILFIAVLALLLGLLYLLIRYYLKERKRYREDKEIMMDGVLSKSAMASLIASYVFRVGRETPFGLIYVDIDSFSEYNNAFGQKEGDHILERLSLNIKNALPKGVKVGRYYADQFVIFVSNEYTKSQTVDLAARVREAVQKPINLFGDTDIKVTASVGIAFYPLHGGNFKELIRSLQIAVYILKKNGGNGIKVYSEELGQEEGQYVDYYYQIKSAINRNEFRLYYHPMIDTKNDRVFGFETLIRWNHPEFGILSPNKFLSIMEQSGDIHWIGRWGLETTIKSLRELQQEFPNQDLQFSINLSPKQMMDEELAVEFQRIIRKYRVDPKRIILEIIEFALFEKQPAIFNNIEKLKSIGFRIAIDGFGLEYSTLAKLEKLPVDIIKLDSNFLLEEQAYVKAKFAELLVDYATKNDYLIICETVENEKMIQEAKRYQIDIMQGFYFSKPMPVEDISSFIRNESWKKNEFTS
ncbi:MAG: putative bifunctional diguanylate cyclase/phosphodiesterase [Acholeplasmataceae bacterium]